MKIREIDRKNYLKNSPLKYVIYIGTLALAGCTVGAGYYYLVLHPEKIKPKIQFYANLFEIDDIEGKFKKPKVEETADKKLQSSAYKQYLEEKARNKQLLEEDTRERLDRILKRSSSTSSTTSTTSKTSAAKDEPVPSKKIIKPENATTSNSNQSSEFTSSSYTRYLYSWINWFKRSPQPPSPSN